MTQEPDVDEKDLLVLRELQRDSRQNMKQIAKKVDMPRSTVHNRIKRMIDEEIIRKFTIIPDFRKTGKKITAYSLLKYELSPDFSLERLGKELGGIPGVVSVHPVSGEWDMIVKTRVGNMRELNDTLNHRLPKVAAVSESATHIVFDSLKEEYL